MSSHFFGISVKFLLLYNPLTQPKTANKKFAWNGLNFGALTKHRFSEGQQTETKALLLSWYL